MGKHSKGELVQGTLDMLILSRLARGPMHGFGIAEHIQQVSNDVLRVEEGSLYPALHRLEAQGMITSEWGASANNRQAKFYKLTPRGRKQAGVEVTEWQRLVAAIARVIEPV
jgi:transcriptional regulator